MRRALACLLALLSLAGCTGTQQNEDGGDEDAPPAPPPPPPPPSEGSVDVAPGDTWRYQARDGSLTTVVVLSEGNGTIRIRSTTVQGNNSTVVTSLFDERTFALQGIFDPRFGVQIDFEPAIPIIVPAEDHRYEGNLSIATILGDLRQPVSARVVFYGLENVTVPAGNFTTYHYAVDMSSDGTYRFRQTRHLWFAPEVDQAVLMFSEGRTDELVGYTRARAPATTAAVPTT